MASNSPPTSSATNTTTTTAPDNSHSDSQTPNLDLDLEKQSTHHSSAGGSSTSSSHNHPTPRPRLTRTQSLTRCTPPNTFTHALSHQKTSADNLVDFDGPDDPYHPLNWPLRKKVITTVLYGLTTLGTTWTTAAYAPAVGEVQKAFGVGREVALLGTTLLLLGVGMGPLIFAPLSEVYGRKLSVITPVFIAGVFALGTAAAKDIQTVLITRFFCGLFGSAPVTNTGGVLGDIWSPQERGTALVGYAFAVVAGPTIGPIVSTALIENSPNGWRHTEYLTAAMMLTMFTLDILILDETYAPTLLTRKARSLRLSTRNFALHSAREESSVSVSSLLHKFGARPFQLLATPICFLVASYASFVFGILYLFLSAIPIAFGPGGRNWSPVVAELPFIGFLLGVVVAGGVNIYNNRFYIRKFEAAGGKAVPEARLPPMMLGSVFLAAGLFVFGWTSDPRIHWIVPVIGLVVMAFGFFTVFQAALNYLIDAFRLYAASAIAANTFLRSIAAGTFPLFVEQMYSKLGIPWATSVLGFIAILMIPIPYVFYFYGARIRAKGKYTASLQT